MLWSFNVTSGDKHKTIEEAWRREIGGSIVEVWNRAIKILDVKLVFADHMYSTNNDLHLRWHRHARVLNNQGITHSSYDGCGGQIYIRRYCTVLFLEQASPNLLRPGPLEQSRLRIRDIAQSQGLNAGIGLCVGRDRPTANSVL